jgi:hypothetical protein
VLTPADCLAALAEQRLLPPDRRATYLSGADRPADPVQATVVVAERARIAGLTGPDAGRAGRWPGPRRSCYRGDRRWDVDFWADDEVDRLLRAVSWQALESGRSVGLTLRRYELEFVQRLGTARPVEGRDWIRRRQEDFAGSAVRTMVATQLLMTLDRQRERAGRLLAAGDLEGAVLTARAAVGTAVDAVLATRGAVVADPAGRTARLRRLGRVSQPSGGADRRPDPPTIERHALERPATGPGLGPEPPTAEDYWRLETMRDLDPAAPAGWLSAALLFCARTAGGLQP